MKRLNLILLFCSLCCFVQGREYHVSVKGNDNNAGTVEAPFKTINRAVYYAFPGDIITVYAGTYREWVNPLRGGTSDEIGLFTVLLPEKRSKLRVRKSSPDGQKRKAVYGK